MSRPEIKIGERTFEPKPMSFRESVQATAVFALAATMFRYLYPWGQEYRSLVKETRLAIFYGEEAAEAFQASPH